MARVHVETIRVRYGETDQMGVVYYANYLRYFEVARVEWLRAHGFDYAKFEEGGRLMPVIEAHVNYKAPARFDDRIAVACEPRPARIASGGFDYRVERDGKLLVSGWTMHACVGRDGRLQRFPDELKRLFEEA